jgi:hypothetical protein
MTTTTYMVPRATRTWAHACRDLACIGPKRLCGGWCLGGQEYPCGNIVRFNLCLEEKKKFVGARNYRYDGAHKRKQKSTGSATNTLISLCFSPGLFLHTRGLEQLRLNGNEFKTIPAAAFIELGQLQHLELSDNPRLEVVSSGAFQGLAQLTSLRLSRNSHLARLEAGVLEPLLLEASGGLRHLDLAQNNLTRLEDDLRRGRQLSELRLTANPWRCDCHLRHLQEVLKQQPPHSEAEAVMCAQPAAAADRSLLAIDLAGCPVSSSTGTGTRSANSAAAAINYHHQETVVVIVLSVIVVLVVLALAGLMLLRYRRNWQRLLKRLRGGKRSEVGDAKLGGGGGYYGQVEAQKSFIQHEEYFLSLARQQAEYSGGHVPVTEL